MKRCADFSEMHLAVNISTEMDCYCCSNEDFANCCQPFIDGTARPVTALQLMRSRYTAYVVTAVDYLWLTTHPATRKYYERESIREWAQANRWQKLEIIAVSDGGAKDKKGIVEFKAHYLNKTGRSCVHHEVSNFAKELGKWFFVDGRVVDPQETSR